MLSPNGARMEHILISGIIELDFNIDINIKMRELNGKREWITNLCFKPADREQLYFSITNSIDDMDVSLCDISNKIKSRIGSESQNAEVYMTGDLAIKVLPLINKNSFEKNINEITITELASQAVLENRTIHFPIMYGFDLCENTIFYNDNFTRKSIKYQDGQSKSHIIFMELGCCDLKYYMNNNSIESEELTYIKKQCMEAISDMHMIIGVCHNDLHLGNFLLLPYGNKYGYIILIHDFGNAEFRTSYHNLDYEFFEEQF